MIVILKKTTEQLANFRGRFGDFAYNTDTDELLFCDGVTLGGVALAGTAAVTGTTVESDLGTPKWTGKFTITDAGIGPTSKVLCWQAPGPYTGKGTLDDEAQMQPVNVIAVTPASGSAVVYWQTPPMVSTSNILTQGQITSGTNRDLQIKATRLGKVRGNVKFTYTILT